MPPKLYLYRTVMLLAVLSGCSGEKPPATSPPPAISSPVNNDPAATQPAVVEDDTRANELLRQVGVALEEDRLADAEPLLDELRGLTTLSEAEQAQLIEIESKIASLSDRQADAERETRLKQVAGLISNGNLDDAATALDNTAARKPTDEQRTRIAEFRDQIERIRGAQRKLGAWMKLIGSQTRSEFRAAQNALLEEPEAALPLLTAALQEPGDKRRTTNILETLRQLRKPQATLPVIMRVLERSEQKESWPDVVESLSRMEADGAGPLLLSLWSSSQDAEQRAAALAALSQVPDPPAETTLTLLPRLFEDAPDLSATLACVAQAVRRHNQGDLVGLHGFGSGVSAEQSRQLAALPVRLEALRMSTDPATRRAASTLSVMLRLMTAEGISGVEVLNVSAQYPDSPGDAALDGVWNSTDLKTMWYHPLGGDSQIVLDLGSERTVTGVVIWNFNQPGGGFRGWKTAEIFVSPTPTALTPVASGVVAIAPGVADPADYGTLIPVPCVTGRYVKLKARDLWNANAYTGLAEVQVLGF